MFHVRKLSYVAVVAAVFVAGCGKEPRKVYEKAGGFSYDPPAGWETGAMPGMKYQMCHGERADGFTPNINVVDENYSGGLPDYVDLNATNLAKVFTGMKIVSRDGFTNSDGDAGFRIVIHNPQMGKVMQQSFYFFGHGSHKYVMTCSALEADGAKFEPLFDACAKSFRMH